MRKYNFVLATAVIIVSCTGTDSVKEVVSPEVPINFVTYTQPTTKAENNGTSYSWSLEDHHTTFLVFGSKVVTRNNQETTESVFDKQEVEYKVWDATSTVKEWNYTPVRYWDKAAKKYIFYAAAPVVADGQNYKWILKENKDNDGNTEYTEDTYYFTYSGYTLADHDATVAADEANNIKGNEYVQSFNEVRSSALDLMIAEKQNNWTDYTKAVTLNFNHILSRLNVLIQRGSDLADEKKEGNTVVDKGDIVELLEFKVFTFKNGGNFIENNSNAVSTNGGTKARWEIPSGTTTIDYTATSFNSSSPLLVTDDQDDNDIDNKQYILQSLVVPQAITYEEIKVDGTDTEVEAYLYIKYTITNEHWKTSNKTETFEGYYNLAAAFGATASSTTIDFNEGWQNNLTIRINPAVIEFDPQVSEWGDNVSANYDVK